jgi:type III restriction enzyme
MAECLTCLGGTFPAYLLWRDIGDKAAERIFRACTPEIAGPGTLRPILDPYNEAGSSRHVSFATTKTNFWTPDEHKCQVNLIVCDENWEAAAAQMLDGMPEVLRYVKNDRLGFEVPYVDGSTERHYRPDFIVVVDDGRGPNDPLHLVLEVKGRQTAQDDAKHDTTRKLWVPSVNAQGRFGRWDFCRVDGPYGVDEIIRRRLNAGALSRAA